MKLALVSPLPPAASGVAEFSARLAEGLARFFEVEAMDDPAGVDLGAFNRRLYQIGNNPLHQPAYDAALATPGVVELHDAVLQHFLLGRLDEAGYLDEMVFNSGEWLRDRARILWSRRGSSAGDGEFFRYPLLRRIVESAEKVIVHNPAAARLAREASPHAPEIVEIPHFVDPALEVAAEQVEAVRAELGAKPEDLLIGCFGYQRPTKRLHSVLAAARRLKAQWKVLIAGSFVSSDYEASLAPLLDSPRVVRRGRLSDRELAEYAAAVDVCVNLRWPTAGESSGIAMRLLAVGKPVIVTDTEEWSAFGDNAIVRVDAGPAEVDMLAGQLELLASSADLRRAIGDAGRRHVAEKHAFGRVLEAYRGAL